MMKLDNFIGMMTGYFDNKEQFNMMQATGKIYPYKFFYRDCSRNALSRGKRNDCVRILSGKVKNI